MAPRVIVVPHTHWDREWYRTFQGYRLRMVEAIDRILRLLEDGVLPHFLLDGQTVMLDDYLEIRPEDEERIRKAVHRGQLGIGPWYILPDEFLVSGESLVRNLLFGQERMARFGAEEACGYLPDMFGHTAQMPQILRGFGMDRAVVWRGVDPPSEHFWWEDPSGDGIATVFLPTGYCNTHLWQSGLDPAERARRHQEFLSAHRLSGPLLLLSGCDHLAPNQDLPEIARAAGAVLGRIDDALPPAGPGGLPVVSGELRQQGRAYLLPDVASARMPIKQQNAELEDLWERTVEPLLALRTLCGDPIDLGFWREGWELILKNQPHDSVCGCSIDEVHKEMEARFSQARTLGHDLVSRSLDAFAPRKADPGVIVFNPMGSARSGWVEVEAEAPLTLDPTWAQAHLAGVPSVFLEAADTERFYADIDYHPDWKPIRRYRMLAYFKDLPAVGVEHFLLAPGPGSAEGAPTDILTGENFIENSFVRLEVSEGQLKLLDKGTGTWISEVLRFVDGGDAGDEYTYSPPEDDRVKTAHLQDYEVVEATLARATLALESVLNIPAALAPSRQSRAMLQVTTALKTRITLVAGERTIRFETTFDNWAQDHRLRALVATGITAPDHMASEAAFGAIERQVSLGLGSLPVAPLAEAVPPTFPHLGWVAVEGPRLAMQVLAPGLPEAEILAGGGAIAVTLLRCVGWLSRDDLRTRGGGAGPHMPTPDAQLEGSHRFVFFARFASPAAGGRRAWWDALADLEQARLALAVQPTGGHRQPLAREVPAPGHWFGSLPEAALLCAVKPACDGRGIVVRAFNPTGEPRAFPLALDGFDCQACDLAELAIGPRSERCEALLAPGSIVSFRLAPHGR